MSDSVSRENQIEAINILNIIWEGHKKSTEKEKLSEAEWVKKIVSNILSDKDKLRANAAKLIKSPPSFILSEYLNLSTTSWKKLILGLSAVPKRKTDDNEEGESFKDACEQVADTLQVFFAGCKEYWSIYRDFFFTYQDDHIQTWNSTLKTYTCAAIGTALYRAKFCLTQYDSDWMDSHHWHTDPIPTHESLADDILRTDDESIRRTAKIETCLANYEDESIRVSRTIKQKETKTKGH